ncbi:DUF3450 domain-containing protein [Desulfonatronovibrio magnus]|uniref:DUF3450 domain-containing protein n=1 Tax=Desulfonatronovibrio magnus TaxID=698827 RepID=UPI000697A4E1|nr:DUF3450 domain-containing protein [Desulfonatronovibrio magnus]
MNKLIIILIILFAAFFPARLMAGDKVQQIVQEESIIIDQGRQSQDRIDKMSEETRQLLNEYRDLSRQHRNLVVYNDNLNDMVNSQQEEVDSLERQINDIQVTKREIVPLMLHMLDTLEDFVHADLPFLQDERRARVEGLRNLMVRADVDIPEKFRQIMLAYQTESDFGRSMEAFQGELVLDGQERSVEFLRIGRLVLAYQTLDRSETGFWSARDRAWLPLERRYNQTVRQGIRIAGRQAAPELIQVPVIMSLPVFAPVYEDEGFGEYSTPAVMEQP